MNHICKYESFVLTLALERYGGRRTVLMAACNREIECSKFQPPEKCFFFFVDKDIGAIWPNSCAQSQMKLFAGKINPRPPPLSRPCICQVFVGGGGFWVYWSCVRHAAICVSVSETVTACAARQNTHAHRNKHTHGRRRSIVQSMPGARSIKK